MAAADGGMAFKDWPFKDGEAPPQSTVENWLALVDDVFSDDRPEVLAREPTSLVG